jgi:hypothetical protein
MTDGKRYRRFRVCRKCGRSTPDPITGIEAAKHRLLMLRSVGPDCGVERAEFLAFCWCRSTVLMTTQNALSACKCDRANWRKAGEEMNRDGIEACWARLGVTDALMAEARLLLG